MLQKLNIDSAFSRYGLWLGALGVFLLPLKLSLAYLVITPLLLVWLLEHRRNLRDELADSAQLYAPFLIFLAFTILTSLFGIDPLRSLKSMPALIVFSLLIPVFNSLGKKFGVVRFLLALALGQALAACNAILFSFDPNLTRVFLGRVSESGQLGLTIVATLGLMIFSKYASLPAAQNRNTFHWYKQIDLWVGLFNAALLVALGFHSRLLGRPLEAYFLAVALILSLALCVARGPVLRKLFSCAEPEPAECGRLAWLLATVIIPLLFGALIVNLKRGPWAGVAVGGMLLLFMYEQRLILPALALACGTLIFVDPVRSRLANSSGDFFIAGGRSVIWEIGAELATRYPLGVGFKNSPFLRSFSTEVPPELTHFHNNFLNVAVETGWLGVLLFIYWIFSIIKRGMSLSRHLPYAPLAHGITCAIISWQVAGLVEYNFGDSEVVKIAFVLIGLLISTLPSAPSQLASKKAT